jgi:hypothetical protein
MRALVLLALAVLAGAAVTVLVAWGCALGSKSAFVASPNPASARLASFAPAEWRIRPPGHEYGYHLDYLAATVWKGFGASVETCYVQGGWRTGELHSDEYMAYGILRREECGWPIRCLECGRADQLVTAKSQLIGGIEVPESMRGPSPAPAAVLPTPYRPAFPVHPLWPAFAYGTGLYAVLIALPLAGPRWMRRVVRARRGRCVKCGYDRGGLAPGAACPECGTAPAS